jgi:NTE family protein
VEKKYKTGFVLSGGGARGFAHLGVARALYEHGIYPDIISGVSSGSIAGVFLADGWSPEDIFRYFKDTRIFKISRLGLPQDGLLSLDKMKNELDNVLKSKDISELKKPFIVAASNLNTGRIEYFSEGPASELVMASSAIPVLFSPVKIGNDLYVDGGLFDNLPVSPLKGKCSRIIGVNVNPIHPRAELKGLIQVASRAFHLGVDNTIRDSRHDCDIFIEPAKLDRFDILDFKSADEMYEIGYEYAMEMVKN